MNLADKYKPQSQLNREYQATQEIAAAKVDAAFGNSEIPSYNATIDSAFESSRDEVDAIKRISAVVRKNYQRILEQARSMGSINDVDQNVYEFFKINGTACLFDEIEGFDLLIAQLKTTGSLKSFIISLKNNTCLLPLLNMSVEFKMLLKLDEYQVYAVANESNRATTTIAGAGAGKTLALETWVFFLIMGGLAESKILCICFSDAAATVMKVRISKFGTKVAVRTFHGFALWALKTHDKLLVEPVQFDKIMDETSQKHAVRKILNDNGLPGDANDFIKLLHHITLLDKNFDDVKNELSAVELVFIEKYKQYKTSLKMLDFDDMLLLFVANLRRSPEFRRKLQHLFDAICIDEAQDCSLLFIEIIRLMDRGQRWFVVGDPSQRIYGFAGAAKNAFKSIQTILNARMAVLPYNHRSYRNLVVVCDRLIRSEKNQIVRPTIAAKSQDGIIEFTTAQTPTDELMSIFNKIMQLITVENFKPNEIAILCRTNRQVQSILTFFSSCDHPFKNRYNLNIRTYEQEYYNLAIEFYLLFAVWNSADGLAGVLRDTLFHIYNEIDLRQLIGKLGFPCIPAMELLHVCITPDSRLSGHLKLLNALAEAGEAGISALPSKIDRLLSRGEDPSAVRHELYKILGLYRGFRREGTFQQFLEWLRFSGDTGSVTVSTAHKSKGTEFPVVFIPGLVENLWPHYHSINSIRPREDLETEFLLFYVSCTRAEQRIYLSNYMTDKSRRPVVESRFLLKILDILNKA